jgi:hypothetical protein
VVEHDYFRTRRYREEAAGGGLEMTLHGMHRSLETTSRALEANGFVIEALREIGGDDCPSPSGARIPLFLDIRSRLAGG